MNIILRDYESVWPDVWLQNKCRSLWPIFHGPLMLPYILKTVRCMKIILWDYESVWHGIWPQNNNVVHCDLYFIVQWFCLIPWRLWYMSTILWDYESVWHYVWPKYKRMSLWPIFHGPAILPYILKIIQWLNMILWDSTFLLWKQLRSDFGQPCDSEVKVSMTYISQSSDFALYLENCLMYEHHTLG